jgi:hypothetical protein
LPIAPIPEFVPISDDSWPHRKKVLRLLAALSTHYRDHRGPVGVVDWTRNKGMRRRIGFYNCLTHVIPLHHRKIV